MALRLSRILLGRVERKSKLISGKFSDISDDLTRRFLPRFPDSITLFESHASFHTTNESYQTFGRFGNQGDYETQMNLLMNIPMINVVEREFNITVPRATSTQDFRRLISLQRLVKDLTEGYCLKTGCDLLPNKVEKLNRCARLMDEYIRHRDCISLVLIHLIYGTHATSMRLEKLHALAYTTGIEQSDWSMHDWSMQNSVNEEIQHDVPIYRIHTFPVDRKSVADGDTVTVYVNADDPHVLSSPGVRLADLRRRIARAKIDYTSADRLHDYIVRCDFRMIRIKHKEQLLAKKFRIRLRGIDAPEGQQTYGKEATNALLDLVEERRLVVDVYGQDCYKRTVGDLYTDEKFLQEEMLKNGHAWHYYAYDKRPEFAMWEAEARKNGVGLWAHPNPEKPWEWRKTKCETN